MKRTLYLATHNEHKVDEFRAMLGHLWEVRSARELEQEARCRITWDETGHTFEENSRIKALALRKYTRAAVLADDSGLMVDALNGAPGIYSARYAAAPEGTPRAQVDRCNVLKLLKEIENSPNQSRVARFVCCLVFIDENGVEQVFTGTCEGLIARQPSGDHGFGYDPVFFLPSRNMTMAELNEDEKNRISHRSAAIALFLGAAR